MNHSQKTKPHNHGWGKIKETRLPGRHARKFTRLPLNSTGFRPPPTDRLTDRPARDRPTRRPAGRCRGPRAPPTRGPAARRAARPGSCPRARPRLLRARGARARKPEETQAGRGSRLEGSVPSPAISGVSERCLESVPKTSHEFRIGLRVGICFC